MVLSRKKEAITLDFLFSNLDDLQVYRRYIPTTFLIGAAFCNPFRKDKNPSFCIHKRNDGHLHHIDYADDFWSGGCVDLVKQKFSITTKEAMEMIATDFGISNYEIQKYNETHRDLIKTSANRQGSIIMVTAGKWTKEGLEYWRNYGIDKKTLKQEQIYQVKEWSLNRTKMLIRENELCFCYHFPDNKFKIYYPQRKKNAEPKKWYCNVKTSYIEGLENLHKSNTVILTKSRKDRIVLQRILPKVVVINSQNESRSSFSKNTIDLLKDKDVYINFDCDPPGKKSSLALTTELGYRHVNVPDYMLEKEGIKDFADWQRLRGNDKEIKEFLKSKKLYDSLF